MKLYDYLGENLREQYDWEEYTFDIFDEVEIPGIKEDCSLLCEIWDLINEWASEYADDFCNADAALIVKILNETLTYVNSCTAEGTVSLSVAADLCSIYARCCIFAKNEMAGTEICEKCKFAVNNTIADCIISKKEPCIEFEDVEKCDPDEDCWEEI